MSFIKEKLEKKFKEEYEKLNEAQRLAVDTTEGPVMVIAGPGTGKTQILACRIGKILLETDAMPQNILCLTYTEAGVVAMRKRLTQFIGSDAYKVNIYTYHSFCNTVIQENLSLFAKREMDAISDLEKTQLLKELIDRFPKNHPLKRYRGDVYYESNGLSALFSTMKQEGWSSAFLIERIDAYINDLPTRDEYIYKKKQKEFNKGDLKITKLNAETEKMEKLKAAVNEFDNFQAAMNDIKRYDFDDMINWVIEAFQTNTHLLANYQERFQYVLVDEYQDTNGSQDKLVSLLINYWEQPNIFVVGDDDQSIFRFQGASVENMHNFYKHYEKDLQKIVLQNNYRSTQPILDVAQSLIEKNDERLINIIPGLTKDLIASNEALKTIKTQPLIFEYPTMEDEMIGVVKKIQKLLAENVLPGEIGIIYKEHKYGEELSHYFNVLNIPIYTKRQPDIMDFAEAKRIFLFIKYLASELDAPYGGDEMLFELLHFSWFGIPPIEIAKLSVETADRISKREKTSLRQLLFEKANSPDKDLFTQNIHPQLKNAAHIIEALIADAANYTVRHLFENIINKAGILNEAMQHEDKHRQLRILTKIFDFVKDETHRNPELTLQSFVALITIMESEHIKLPLNEVSGNEAGVNLMTAHGSKGLEFEYIFLVGSNAHLWEKKSKTSKAYTFPDTVFLSTATTKDAEVQEQRRLFYVACTRAKKELNISYFRFKSDTKDAEPSLFVIEVIQENNLPINLEKINAESLSEFAVLKLSAESKPEIEKLETDYVNKVLEKFTMNVTALNNYLRCPLEFYYKNVIKIPSAKSENLEFGSAIHYALEQLFRKMLGNDNDGNSHSTNVFPPKEIFIKDFEWFMHRNRESFTKEQYNRRIEYGREILANYYDQYIHSFKKIVSVEKMISGVVINGVPIKGKLDKLEFDGKSVNVVDYKTGNFKNAQTKLVGPTLDNPSGNDYWRQAVFYKLLVDNYSQKDWIAVSAEFDFIEPDDKNKYQKIRIPIEPDDVETLIQIITETWNKIQQHDFYKGCGKKDCHSCNFVKENKIYTTLIAADGNDEA